MKKRIQNSDDYLIESKPPRAGDPIITANVIIIPKPTPTITKRMFISKLYTSQLKIDGIRIGMRFGRML